MSLVPPHGAAAGLGVVVLAGIGAVGSLVAGVGTVEAARPGTPTPAVRPASCTGHQLPALGG
ncbi:MAG: hypothetical protein ACTHKG_17975, partial [Nocardioides sp.]